jgi:predicted RNA-binding Zn-ribbon protein involved in translation (DUF1610 family)
MEIKKFDLHKCSKCDIEFFVPLDQVTNFCPFCGKDEDIRWHGEVEMVVE